jgi:hypothetical protein
MACEQQYFGFLADKNVSAAPCSLKMNWRAALRLSLVQNLLTLFLRQNCVLQAFADPKL